MKVVGAWAVVLLMTSSLLAQNRGRSGAAPAPRTGGAITVPSGTSGLRPAGNFTGIPPIITPPGITSPTFGSHPGGPGFNSNQGRFGGRNFNRTAPAYGGYPIIYGGSYAGGGYYYDPSYYGEQSYYGSGYGSGVQQQPNVIVVYPPQQGVPMMVGPGDQGGGPYMGGQPPADYPPPVHSQTSEPPSSSEPAHYLIAFKDHSIYSAVAYWVDGDTLHYFTDGSTHRQAPIATVDRDLTLRLNQDSGAEVKLPPAR